MVVEFGLYITFGLSMRMQNAYNYPGQPKPGIRMLGHIIFWLAQFGLFLMLDLVSQNFKGNFVALFLETLKNTLIPAFIFYTLMYFILPRFLLAKRFFLFFVLSIVLFLIAAILDTYAWRGIYKFLLAENMVGDKYFFEWVQGRGLMSVLDLKILVNKFFVFTRFLAFPIMIKTIRSFYRYKADQLYLEKQYMRNELSFLRSQISPHVLFNAFNNLYSLIMQNKVDQSARLLEKLSDFLRRVLYESKDEFVKLSEELLMVHDFIEIERIRDEDLKIEYVEDVSGASLTQKIPRFLFLPVVENSFKHARINERGDFFVKICITQKADAIYLRTSNSYRPDKELKREGLGLATMQKRLAIYFPNGYEVTTEAQSGIFNFSIRLDKILFIE